MNRSIIAAVAVTAAFAVPAAAHHSAAMFDFAKPVTRTGTVKEIKVINPHTHMLLTITDGKGTRVWDFEGHSASNFYRAGYTRDAVKPGDKIAITFAPMRSGADGGYIVSFVTAKGTKVGFSPPG